MSETFKAEDLRPGGAIYEAAIQAGVETSKKIEAWTEGYITFNELEMGALKVLMQHLVLDASTAKQTNYVIGVALYRKHLQIVHQEEADGTYTVDLVTTPEPKKETVN